jgi:hypothetical protein
MPHILQAFQSFLAAHFQPVGSKTKLKYCTNYLDMDKDEKGR